MKVSISALLVAVGAVVALDGCGDPTAIAPQFVITDRPNLVVFALNGTPPTVPSAIAMRTVSLIRPDANFAFDVALDLNAANEVVVHTVRSVASQLAPGHRVGLQQTDKSFADATVAPVGGYTYDSSMVAPIGRTIFVDVLDASCSSFSLLGQNIRAKMVVDSIDASTRRIYVHVLADPNCGFRGLGPGGELPKE